MKIGVDIGGSHISCGLVKGKEIILKKEEEILNSQKRNIQNTLKSRVINIMRDLLKEAKINLEDIEEIGISAPRKNSKWNNCIFTKLKY